MKIDRLLGIIMTLLNHNKLKAKDLAEKYEVSLRTIYRDIDAICQAGIPIVTYPGGDGGVAIAEGFKLNKNILNKEELNNIVTGLKGIDSISQGKQVQHLLEKLLPREEVLLSPKDHIFIDLGSFYKNSLSHKISVLKEAISLGHEISFDYFSNRGMTERFVEPYFISFKWSDWYVFGFCLTRKDFRLFKLNRMDKLILTEKPFVKRKVPEEKTTLDHYFTQDQQKVTLLLDPSVEYKIVESYGVGSYERMEDQRLKFTLFYTNKDYALETILSLGHKAEVIEPKEMIEEIKTCADNILKKYQ